MIRLYSGSRDAEQKRSMAFELSPLDHRLLRFGELFRERFMRIDVSMPLEKALDLCWQTMAECFEPQELLMKQSIVDKYFPRQSAELSRESAEVSRATVDANAGEG